MPVYPAILRFRHCGSLANLDRARVAVEFNYGNGLASCRRDLRGAGGQCGVARYLVAVLHGAITDNVLQRGAGCFCSVTVSTVSPDAVPAAAVTPSAPISALA